ncbi:MAG: TadE/TadG family type IV pilus assembly protein [Bellilinea sp.]
MKTHLNKHRMQTTERGQSLVELALILLILLLLVAGIVDLGRMVFTYLTMRDAAQEGAVYGAIYPGQCEEVFDRIQANLPVTETFTVTINGLLCTSEAACDCSGSPQSSGDIITVMVTVEDFDITTPLISVITGPTVDFSATINDTVLDAYEATPTAAP